MRSANLARALLKAGHEVVLWTADFQHMEHKHQFGGTKTVTPEQGLVIHFLQSRGYRRNIGFERLVDHAQLAWNLKSELRKAEPPDVAFVGYPPIEPAFVMVEWLKKRSVPTLLDVKDRWPDVLLRALPASVRPLGRVALSPHYALAARTFRDVSGITSITESFLRWSLREAGRSRGDWDQVVPLTAPETTLTMQERQKAGAWWDTMGVPDDGRPRASFVGTLGASFDFRPVAQAARTVDAQFVICGTGSQEAKVAALFARMTNVVLPGWVSTQQAEVLAGRSSVALAPYVPTEDFLDSLPNKLFDALAHGLPFVTSLQGEVGTLIADHDVGRTYDYTDPDDLAGVLGVLMSHPEVAYRLGRNAKELYASRYSVDVVYGRLVGLLERLAAGRSGVEP